MLLTVSLDSLTDFAKKFWDHFASATVFAFHGEMGAGKTTIITALCQYKGVKTAVSSPTFSIINEYRFQEKGRERKIFHMDLYRLNSMEEMIQAGVEDSLYSGEICFVEWPEKAPALLEDGTIHITIDVVDATTRMVKW